jgi:hypothetical protein
MATKRLWQRMMDNYPLHPFWPASIELKISAISEEKLNNLRKIAKFSPHNVPAEPAYFEINATTVVSVKDSKVDMDAFDRICKDR